MSGTELRDRVQVHFFISGSAEASRELDLKVVEVAEKLNALIDVVDGILRRSQSGRTDYQANATR